MKILRKFFCLLTGGMMFISCGGSDHPEPEPLLPALSVFDVTQLRDSKQASLFRFNIHVVPSGTNEIKINYTTRDGSAIGGKDYTATSGVLIIPPGQADAFVDVTVFADSLRQGDQLFYLELTSPVNATISGPGKATATIQNDGTWLPVDGTGFNSSTSYPGMNLIWSDEFKGKTMDNNTWYCETGGGGWGNNELEYYTNNQKNSFVSNGYLIIEARKEISGSNNYTSARVISKDRKTFTYGRIDIRARLPKGKGIWPAIWMLGNNISQSGYGWPACGEIDIMELLGHEPQKMYGTMHWGPAGGSSIHIGGNYSLSSGDFSSQFHVFSLKWESDKLVFLVDDVAYFTGTKTQVNGNYPFDKPFFFIMNVAVGGNWPGNPDASTVFPQRMIVDFVRVFQ